MWISRLFPTITEKRESFELYIGSNCFINSKRDRTLCAVFFFFYNLVRLDFLCEFYYNYT